MLADAVTVLDELVALHKEIIFPGLFERIKWHMVASFECNLARENGRVKLKHTTFWLSPDRDPKGMMRLEFDDEQGREFGMCISSDKLTAATGKSGAMSAILGFSPTQKAVDDVIEANSDKMAVAGVVALNQRGIRPSNRRRRRR